MGKFGRTLNRGVTAVWAAFIVVLLSATAAQAQTATSITLTSSNNPTVAGQSALISVTLNYPSGTPTGLISIFIDGVSVGGVGAQFGGAIGTSLPVGSHTVTATYPGDANFAASSATPLTQVVNKADTASTVTSSINPEVFGQSVTFTATVSPVAPGAGTPTGTVTFLDGGSPIGTGTLSGGIATFTTSALAVGNHTITTSYGGDGNFNGSTGSLTGNPEVVNKADSATAVTSSVNPEVFGQSVTFTATISAVAPGGGTPTGTVTFLDGGSPIGTGTLSGGIATFTTSALAIGNHTITTSYGGDGNFNGSTGSLTGNPEVVNKDSTTTGVTSSANPSVFGQPVTFTATVTPNAPGGGTPTGTVTFFINGLPTLVSVNGSGQAMFTTSSLGVGPWFVLAVYSGDGNFNGSSGSLTQTVNQDATTTAVGSSVNPSIPGQSVLFTATVTANAPGAGTPTGSVTFVFDGGALTATATLVGGVGMLSTSSLSTGTHTVVATYNGDNNFLTSSGTVGGGQIVNQIATSTALTPSVNPSTLGQSVTFTATVTPTSGGPPTGSVTFTDVTTATTLGTQTLNGAGQASFTTSSLALGPHTITASYSGDSTFLASTGTLTQTVNPGVTPSTTALSTSTNPSLSGQAVTFTANVSGAGGPPTGTVTFKDGATTLATVTLAGGNASFTTSSLTVGNHPITANYSGDPTFNASSANLSQTVFSGAQPTTTALASTPNPSVHNQPVAFTATVTSGSGTPTGTVTFLDSGQAIGTATLAAGVATFTTSSLTIGTHSITASYGGANAFSPSNSTALSQAVNVPLDSLKLRALQVQASQIAAQTSGDAFSEAVDAAIADGFSDNPTFATPSENGIHVNMSGQLAAGQQLSDSTDTGAPDPALGRAAVLSDLGTKPAPSTFASWNSSSIPGRDQSPAGPTKPGASNPNQVAALAPAQTAAAPTPTLVGPSPTAWQAWADVRGSGWDNSGSAGDIHGTQVNALVGLTRRLAPDFLIGGLAGYEHFNYSSQLLNGHLAGDGWTAGGYLGWKLDPQLRFDAAFAHSGVNYNGVAGTAAGSFPGSRWLVSAGLTGTYRLMPFEIEPSAKIFALWEHEDPYTDSLGTPQAAFHFTTGRGSGGLKVSYPTALSDGTILKPYLGFYGDYYFSSNNANTVLVPSTFIRGGAGRVTAGVAARLDSGLRLSLGGEYGGIGNNFQNWTVMGRLSVPLSNLFGLPTPMAARAMPSVAAAPVRQVAALQPVTDAPVALNADAPAPSPERIVVRFSHHALFLTVEGRKAFDEAVADALGGKPIRIAIDGCDAGADFTAGSLCDRRQASLQQLLEAQGVQNPSQLLAGP